MFRIVKLNVGGTRYETSISTITQYPNSRLGTMIQHPNMRVMIQNGQELFVDRDGKMFEYILRYLRDGDSLVLPDGDTPGDLATLQQLLLESKFFILEGLKAMIEKKLRVLTKDGWKIGDVVEADTDLVLNDEARRVWSEDYSNAWVGTIVQFRMDGKVAVRFEHNYKDYVTLHLVNLKPKQA